MNYKEIFIKRCKKAGYDVDEEKLKAICPFCYVIGFEDRDCNYCKFKTLRSHCCDAAWSTEYEEPAPILNKLVSLNIIKKRTCKVK